MIADKRKRWFIVVLSAQGAIRVAVNASQDEIPAFYPLRSGNGGCHNSSMLSGKSGLKMIMPWNLVLRKGIPGGPEAL
jgi:hypothetical protein